MASLIPGYNYDIFISYRQKDNKHDGWVTEFVEHLKGELESTFKEEISVYFDINPHDGLLETHDVDESLKEKLKCLVFIPIISRTYCDPKSFAWEHEFKAFIDQASKDEFGLKVKLPNGNVASRVLPVQIHDLDDEDSKTMESVIGSFIRSIEFIYREPGVDRSLTIRDSEEKNLNRTNYRNQINKVALAIKDLISALKNHDKVTELKTKEILNTPQETKKTNKAKLITISAFALAVVILGIMLIPRLFKGSEGPERSIAVLPFKYQSSEPDKQYLADGIMDGIHLNLSKIEDLRVMDRTSVEQYRGTKKTSQQISKELGVVYLVEGRFLKYRDSVRLIVDLINGNEQRQIWSEQYIKKWDEIFSLQSEVAQTIARELNAAITPEEKRLIDKVPTPDLTAYDLTLQAQKIYYNFYLSYARSNVELEKVKQLCKAAIKLDPGYAQAYYWLGKSSLSDQYASGWAVPFFLDTALYFFNKAIKLDSTLSEAYDGRGYYYAQKAQRQKAVIDLNRSISLSPYNSFAYFHLGYTYFLSRDYVKALTNHKKAEQLTKSDAIQASIYVTKFYIYLSSSDFQKADLFVQEAENVNPVWTPHLELWLMLIQGKFEETITRTEKLISINPEFADAYDNQAQALVGLGRIQEAEDCIRLRLRYSEPELNNTHRVGIVFWMNGKRDEAMKYFKKQINYCNESISSKNEYGQMSAMYDLAGIYALLGEKEEAYKWLRAYEKLGFMVGLQEYIKFDPMFDNLRTDDEFKEIVKRANDKAAENRARLNELEEQGVI